jgi:hypothetical protein
MIGFEIAMSAAIIDVDIDAKAPALTRLGASEDDFAVALDRALALLASKPVGDLPRPADIPIQLGGRRQRLGDVADIRVRLG